ncbi:hypothetical protein [Anabaena azotica]|uniref:CpcD n=1 Tax=Anabaena azotica FACHB-119 TaxID=947527 RepID=A0ABR8D1T6_9NOST|nr:hypothetical protein [Anabaena azotica]MBD2501108.1 hypothetical protein [Anabaena azotica FACHB-119]
MYNKGYSFNAYFRSYGIGSGDGVTARLEGDRRWGNDVGCPKIPVGRKSLFVREIL